MLAHHQGRFRVFRGLALGGGLLLALWLAAGAAAAPAAQAVPYRAALVVRYSDDQVRKSCVSFTEPEISGEELLLRSGLVVLLDYNAGLGGAVCSINGQGCGYPAEDCFCQCLGSQCEYWAYYHWENGGWQYSSIGASQYMVTDGAVEGWSWGLGNFVTGVEPPAVAFEDICLAEPSVTPTATATATPPAAAPPAPPQMTFEATATRLAPGSCAVLSWLTWDAERVTLDGAEVMAQDRREVCPLATQHYVLTARNASGSTVREITIQVAGPTPWSDATVSAAAATATPGPILTAPLAQDTLAPSPRAPIGLETPLGFDGARVVEVTVTAAPPPPALSLPPLPTETPRPRRPLGADGRPTPTPLLAAWAPAAGSGEAKPVSADPRPAGAGAEADGRAFSWALLPGYASYLVMAALLAAVGAWVLRRKGSAHTPNDDAP